MWPFKRKIFPARKKSMQHRKFAAISLRKLCIIAVTCNVTAVLLQFCAVGELNAILDAGALCTAV